MGGNVFGNTAPIKREDIKPTLKEFLKQFKQIFPKAEAHFSGMKTIGSVGKKEVSGDIDLVLAGSSFDDVDDWGLDRDHIMKLFEALKKRARTASDEQLMRRAVVVAAAEVIQNSDTDIVPDMKGAGSGQLFLMAPQYNEAGEMLPDTAQIDINVGNPEWLKFSYYSNVYKGAVKGLHRTQLMLAMFTNKGKIFKHESGVLDKETREVEATNPTEALALLNKLYGFEPELTRDIINDYFELSDFLKKQLSAEGYKNLMKIYLKILDFTGPSADIPEDLQQYWIDHQDEFGLTGKYLPECVS